jgi:Leucine-rich repeat (LRR) protein
MLFKNLSKALSDTQNVSALRLKIKEEKLPFDLQVFPHLRELYLEAGALKILSDDMTGFQNLKVLELSAPKLKNISALFHLPCLEILKTNATPLYPLQLGIGLGLAPLKFLTLKLAGLKELPQEMGEFSRLEELNLSHNLLSTLPDSMRDLKKLKRINLDNNQFTQFPDFITQIPSLKHVSIDNNMFSEEEINRIQRIMHLTVV